MRFSLGYCQLGGLGRQIENTVNITFSGYKWEAGSLKLQYFKQLGSGLHQHVAVGPGVKERPVFD